MGTDVFKVMIMLKRAQGQSMSEFSDWWLIQHAPLARQLPDLRRATFNLVRGNGEAEFDGVSELWFDSKQAFENAYQTEIGKNVAADSLANVSRRERFFIDEHIIVD